MVEPLPGLGEKNVDRSPEAWPEVGIVVLNRNGWQDAIECLESLRQIDYPNYRLVVVDNGSTDDSVDQIRRWAQREVVVESPRVRYDSAASSLTLIEYDRLLAESGGRGDDGRDSRSSPSQVVTLIRAGSNLGVPGGRNLGIRYALAQRVQFVLILDNDTVVTPGFLKPLVAVFDRYPSVGVVGPRVLDYQDGSYWQWPILSRPTFFHLLIRPYSRWRVLKGSALYRRLFYWSLVTAPVYCIGGSCMLFPADALNRIGLIDEGTFVFWEEATIAERLLHVGLQCYSCSESVIFHKGRMTALLPGVQIFIEATHSERYFCGAYLELPYYQRRLLWWGRTLVYLARCLRDRSYREHLSEFFRGVGRP